MSEGINNIIIGLPPAPLFMFRKAFPGVDHPSVVDLSTAGLLAPKGEGQVEGNGKRTNNQVNQ